MADYKPPYLTNPIKRCMVIASNLANIENLSEKEVEDLLEEISHLCDQDGVVLFFIENSFHSKLVNLFDIFGGRFKRMILKILTNVIRFEDEVRSRLREDKEFISLIAASFTTSMPLEPLPSNNEACLNFLVEIFGKDQRYLVSDSQEEALLQAVVDSINWDNMNVIYHSINLLNMGFRCEALVTGFLVGNVKNIVSRLCAAGINHKMGIIICKFISNSLDSSESSGIFSAVMEHNLGEALRKILFTQPSNLTAEYYLAAITLLNQLLFFDVCSSFPDKIQLHNLKVLENYQSMVAVSLLEALRTFDGPPILLSGLKTFYVNLSGIDALSTILNKSDQQSWLSLIHEIVTSNFDNADLIEWSFKVLYRMFASNNKLIALIGSNQIAIDSSIIQLFYTQNNFNLSSFIASCDLVSILASNSEKMQNKFLESNIHMIMHFLAIRLTHKGKGSDLEYQVRTSEINALRALILFNLKAKELFFYQEIHYKETKAFLARSFGKGHTVHNDRFYEAAAVHLLFLASLVEYCSFKYDLILGKDFKLSQIMSCETCSMNETIVEAFQELLIVLSGSESETELLLNVWPLESWLQSTSVLKNCYAIQKNTIIFLQLNSSRIDDRQRSNIFLKIGELLHHTNKLFNESTVLKVETFILIYILISQYPDFLKVCTEFNFDRLILDAVLSASNKGLVDVGLQVMFPILESNHTREKIAEKAVRKGNVDLLKLVLEFGTDISNIALNVLMESVRQKQEDHRPVITSYLLQNGCRPDAAVIRSCLACENLQTVGMLLRYYGISDSEKGSIVNWSDLGLEQLQISWLTKLYHSDDGDLSVDERIRCLGKRIKHESLNIMKLKFFRTRNNSNVTLPSRYPHTLDRTLQTNIGGYNYHSTPSIQKSQDDENVQNVKGRLSEDFIFWSHGTQSLVTKGFHINNNRFHSSPIHDSRSMDDLVVNLCLDENIPNDYRYTPIAGEVEEFLNVFRSRSDFCYRSLDPRCLNKRKTEHHIIPSVNFQKENFNGYIRQKSEIKEGGGVCPSISRSDTQNFSDNSSEISDGITSISLLDLSRNNLSNVDVFCEISSEPKLIKIFETITVLKLENNALSHFPKEVFAHLISMEDLDLSGNLLREMPWEVFRYGKLVHLNVTRNKIKSFKISFQEREELRVCGRMGHLRQLKLAENDMTEFMIGRLAMFPNLERLDIHLLPLTFTDDDVFPVPNLKKLHARSSMQSPVGKNLLNNAAEVQSLDLSENQLYATDDLFPIRLSVCENLTELNVSHNNLACKKPFFIPKCILKIPKLQLLNISHNNILEFPACSMWQSSVIRDLDFSHNCIRTLNLLNARPNFQSLQTLNLSYNKLREIPTEIGHLSSLSTLNISYNPSLTSLPDEIGMLKKNNTLSGLVIDGLDLDVKKHLNPNPRAFDILKYYHNRLKNSVEYFGLKMMILGSGGRGKTTLLHSLQGRSEKKSKTSITIGINVSKWRFQGKFNGKPANFKFSCWDFAGQEDFFSSHECFIAQRALYLVVFDLSKGTNEISSMKPWLLNLKSQAPQAPIIIIGTHLDNVKEENRETQYTFLKNSVFKLCIPPAFPKISNFTVVDARSQNKTITHLKNTIIKVLENHKMGNERIIGEKQPESYLKLEEILQETVKKLPEEYPILMEKDIKDIVQKNKLDLDDDELKQALQFLHNCGVIVHFDDVLMKLNNLYFINPQWLCSMMARIITLPGLNPYTVNGTMKMTDFVKLFVRQQLELPRNVDIETHAHQCLKILEKFDVVFQKSKNEIIIPSRLPLTRIGHCQIDQQNLKIKRVFEFYFLPTGFWPRLVTRISVLSQTFNDLISANHNELHVWKQGVTMSWEKSIYMLLEGRQEEREIVEVSVTMCELGLKILVQIIDCIEVIIEEWYPGLMDSDITGNKMTTTYALCPYCDFKFPVVRIMQQSTISEQISCEKCAETNGQSRSIDIRIIAPDLVLGDLPNYLLINPALLEVEKSQENQIGSGGNGIVYRGRYNGDSCAVKFPNEVSVSHDQPSYRLLRQEIDIHRRLRHPSLINLIAVDREKIILELAELGDLNSLLKSRPLGRRYLQRVSYQIIDGLNFLHEKDILYRDLKPHNVLVFSLNLSASINVKLSDYGISRVMAYFGFVVMAGTPGYIAPEVIKRQVPYNHKCDIFSYGILLFNIATRGKHPSDNKTYWRPGANMELIKTFGCENWPRIQECIDSCTEYSPDDRPSAKSIIDFVKCPTFITIKAVWPLTRQTRVECMVTKVNEEGRVEVLLANGNQYKQEVRWIDILSGKAKGKSFLNSTRRMRILCTTLDGNVALLGTHSGEVWVYNYTDDLFNETSIHFPDSILAIGIMTHYGSRVIVFGLANGSVMYKVDFQDITTLTTDDFLTISLASAPVRNLCFSRDKIFATCGPCIFKLVYSIVDKSVVQKKIVEISSSKGAESLIKCFFPVTETSGGLSHISFYFSLWNQPLIYNHDDEGIQLKIPVDCEQLLRKKLDPDVKILNTKVTCVTAYGNNRYLAVGLGSGHLIIIDQKINYVTVLWLYDHSIICLQHTKYNSNQESNLRKSSEKLNVQSQTSVLEKSESIDENRNRSRNSWLIVVGNGYRSINSQEKSGAVLLLMSDDVSKVSRQLQEHLNLRQNLGINS